MLKLVEMEGFRDFKLPSAVEALLPIAIAVRGHIVGALRDGIAGVEISEEAKRIHPFLGDLEGLIEKYSNALTVDLEGETVVVRLDGEKLKSAGLDEDVWFLLEFGDTTFRGIPHLEPVMNFVSANFGNLATRVIDHVGKRIVFK